MIPAIRDFWELELLTQATHQNRASLCLQIRYKCDKILINKQSDEDRLKIGLYIPSLKDRVSVLEKDGIFADPVSGKMAKQALEKVILEYDPLEPVLKKLKKDALENTKEFEKWLKEATLDPELLIKTLCFLAQEKPASFVRLLSHLKKMSKLSEDQEKQIMQFLEQNQSFLFDLLTESLTQSEAIDLYLVHFPADSCWGMDNEFLSLFYKPIVLTPERVEEYSRYVKEGLCHGTAIQHLSGKGYKHSQAYFLQAISETERLRIGSPFMTKLGEKIMSSPEFAPLLQRMKTILGLEDISPNDALSFYVGSSAFKFYMDNKQRYPDEVELITKFLQEIKSDRLDYEIPTDVLQKMNLRKVKDVAKDKPVSEFLTQILDLRDGSYRIILFDKRLSKAHALSFSLDDLSFCDANDFDPETFEPYSYVFDTQEDLLLYINTHLAICYKPKGYELFILTQFSNIN